MASQSETGSCIFFWQNEGKYALFSNWAQTPFTGPDGTVYPTNEHWMMSAKAKLFNDHATDAAILAAPTPELAKSLGRRISPFLSATWDAHKYRLVKQGTLLKFQQNEPASSVLKATGNAELVEGSPDDRIWGIGLTEHDARLRGLALGSEGRESWGENLMGLILMDVRREIFGS